MTGNDMTDPAAFETALASMTEDEVFEAMQQMERKSEVEDDPAQSLALMQLVESEIERRFPGQGLAPYKSWQRRSIL